MVLAVRGVMGDDAWLMNVHRFTLLSLSYPAVPAIDDSSTPSETGSTR